MATAPTVETHRVLAQLETNLVAVRRVEFERLVLAREWAREWALAHPHEYALVYGTPVPGYLAPASTVGPAGRVGGLLARIVADGVAVGLVDPTPGPAGADSTLVPGLAERVGLAAEAGNSLLCARAILAWTTLFGLINFELFGHTHNVVLHHERYFDGAVDDLATLVGLPLPPAPSP